MDPSEASIPGESDISQSIRRRTGRSPLVGRDHELAIVDAEWEAVLGGEARAILLSGDAGIGKTRLLRAASERVSGTGAVVLAGRCVDEQGMPPFLPWIDALSTRARNGSDADNLLRLLLNLDRSDPDRADWITPEQRKLRVFLTVSDVLARWARERPVLLALDDLQWSDAASNELLRYVLTHAGSSRVLMIGTARTDESAGNLPLQRTIDDLHRHRLLTTVPLLPLGPDDIARHVEALTGHANPRLAQAIHAHCEGNPFFAEEVVQQLAVDGLLAPGLDPVSLRQLPIPRSVVAIISRRLDRASPPCRAILEVAALGGTDLSIDLLSTIGELSLDDISTSIDEAEKLGLVHRVDARATSGPEESDDQDHLAFAHDRVRETIEDSMNPVRRRKLHGHIARTMVNMVPVGMDLRHLAAVTYHFRLARQDREAAGYAEALGDAAMRASAHTAAVEAYRVAIERHESPGAHPPDAAPRVSLSIKLGDALLASGDDGRAIDAYANAEKMSASPGFAMEHARALRRLGSTHARKEQFEQAVAYLQAAIDSLQDPDDETEADTAPDAAVEMVLTLFELGAIQGTSLGQYEAAIENGRRGLSLAAELAEAAGYLVPHARLSLAKTLMRSGDLQEGHAVLAPALPLALRSGDQDLAAEIAGALANYHYWIADLAASAGAAHQRHHLALQAGDPFALRHTSSWLANLALARGEWEEARRLLAEAESQVSRVESPEPLAFLRAVAGRLDMQQGRLEEAIANLEAAVEGFRSSGPATVIWYIGSLATAWLESGDDAKAAQIGEETRKLVSSLPPSSLPRAPAIAQLGIIAARTRDIQAAGEFYDSLRMFEGQHHWVLVDRVLGMLAVTLGEWKTAEGHFASATATAMRGGIAPELALTLAERASGLLESAEPDTRAAAAATLGDAVRRLSNLGMPLAADRYAARLNSSGDRPAPRALPAGLTEREAEVLVLVAEGMTNREIGMHLSISEKTVTNHLTHIFTKADLDNRSAAVAFAIRHGLAR